MPTEPVFIVGGARTPMGAYAGPLKDVSAVDLGVIASKGAFERTGVQPGWIDHVVFGNVMQTSADAIYAARRIGLKAGVPIEVPKRCSSTGCAARGSSRSWTRPR